jgi:hypothetical protein
VVYYENPQSYVAGGYSETAAQILPLANVILFANHHLKTAPIYSKPDQIIDLTLLERHGIGYSALPREIPELRQLKATRAAEHRAQFLQKLGVADQGQRIIVYFGGANKIYSEEAFPHFLNLLNQLYPALPTTTFVLQQHPRAPKGESYQPLITSPAENFSLALLAADVALYHQTTANLKFYLLNIPAIQVGNQKETGDLLVQEGLIPSCTTKEELLLGLQKEYHPLSAEEETKAYEAFGIRSDWQEELFKVMERLVR